MVSLITEIEGSEALERRLTTIAHGLSNLEPIWDSVVEVFFKIEADLIRSQGYGTWAPLNPRYALWKSQNYGSQPLLVLSGELRSVMTGSGATIIKDSSSLMIGFTEPDYAKYHQSGTSKMPARPLLIMNAESTKKLEEAVAEEITKMVNRA